MNNILVATDLTQRSDRAMERAALMAKQMNAALHIVHVVDDEVSSVIARAVEKNASEELRRQMSTDPLFKGIKSIIYVEFGDPWKKIVELTDELGVDLLILGAHRNRGIRELFGGTTLHRIAKSCRVPMLVAVNTSLTPYENVIVGVDFSKCARHAVDLATTISPNHPLTFVHAYLVPFKGLTSHMGANGDVAMREKSRIEAETMMQMNAFMKEAHPQASKPQIELIEGGPVAALTTRARSKKADLICVGTHAKPWLFDTFLGSTASELLSYPPCDILIAPQRD